MSDSDATVPLWAPSAERIAASQVQRYMEWLARERGLHFPDYENLRRWSVDELEAFWASLWDYFDIQSTTP